MDIFGWFRRSPKAEPETRRLKPYERLREFWGVPETWGGTSESEIQSLELRYGIRFPEDFREYLLHACPADDNMFDDNSSTWWPISRIKNIPEEYNHEIKAPVIAGGAKQYIFFADYLIWCGAWAIACSDDENHGKIAVIGSPDRFVAESFAQFVDLYIQDVRLLE